MGGRGCRRVDRLAAAKDKQNYVDWAQGRRDQMRYIDSPAHEENVERGAHALTRWLFPGYCVPRREMAAAVLDAAERRPYETTPHIRATGSPVTDEMVERAARALCDEGIATLDGNIGTWSRHADAFRDMARRALAAALRQEQEADHA